MYLEGNVCLCSGKEPSEGSDQMSKESKGGEMGQLDSVWPKERRTGGGSFSLEEEPVWPLGLAV